MTDAVTATLAEWEALYGQGVTIRPDPLPALLGLVKEVREVLADERHEVIGSRGLRIDDVVKAAAIEQAVAKWVGGEG